MVLTQEQYVELEVIAGRCEAVKNTLDMAAKELEKLHRQAEAVTVQVDDDGDSYSDVADLAGSIESASSDLESSDPAANLDDVATAFRRIRESRPTGAGKSKPRVAEDYPADTGVEQADIVDEDDIGW